MVKADGYGHGLEVSARTFVSAGADLLAVATLDEARRLRAVLPARPPILILFAIPPAAVAEAATTGLELAASDAGWLAETLAIWKEVDRRMAGTRPVDMALRLHLEVETGFFRAGLRPAALADAVRAIAGTGGATVAGLWTHLADPADPAVTADQLAVFREAEAAVAATGMALPSRHVAASGGLLVGAADGTELVRPGLALYGSVPDGLVLGPRAAAAAAALRPALSLKARPLRVERLVAGEHVGYGGTWRADRPSRIATLPVGYGDGWSRAYGGRTEALVRGRRVPLVGTVAMDAVAADVTDIEPPVGRGDEFVLLGAQGAERITAEDLARPRTTISWEVMASMAGRLTRVYYAGPRPSGLRTQSGETLGGGTLG